MKDNARRPLIGLTLDQLRSVVADLGLPRFTATQIAQWIYSKRATSIEQMTNLSKTARAALAERYTVGLEPPVARAVSQDGTIKYLFPSAPGYNVEAVYIPDRDRATLCVSCQAGCKMNCAFCMTGRQGFHGQLTAADIINQVMSIDDPASLTNIVFMGMGEPTDNLPAVLAAIEVLTAPWGFAWSPKRITVSSVGRLEQLKELIDRTRVHIALSLHSPYTERRAELMPVERAFPVRSIIEMLRGYDFAHQRRLSVEYIMWAGVNDSQRDAEAVARLLKGTAARVNLIRFHRIPGSDLMPAPMKTMEAFRDRLNALGVTATIRASRGEDIMAACGMLAGKKGKN